MTSNPARAWLWKLAAIVFTIAGVTALCNYSIDLYGLFKDPKGKQLSVFHNERTTKYLYGYRYIPANFDGIMIGTSVSDNWDTSLMQGARVYNASLNGGNISEEKLILDQVLARGKMKLVVFCIYPYLTMNHGRKSGDMAPSEYWGALGSIPLLREYAVALKVRLGKTRSTHDPYGRFHFENAVPDVVKFRAKPGVFKKPPEVVVDEVAFAEYAQLVRDARAHGARIVAFFPPVYAEFYAQQKPAFDAYFARVSALFQPGEQVINFNQPAYAEAARDPLTFMDGIHLTPAAADRFSADLAAAIAAPTGVALAPH